MCSTNKKKKKKEFLAEHAFNILAVRENYPNKTLAELYDPAQMPEDLKQAHEKNDRMVDSLYTAVLLKTDEQRLEGLFKLYEKMCMVKEE